MTTEVADVINTFRMLAELPPDSLGAYVISMARSASDVLAVVLLQRECGVKVPRCSREDAMPCLDFMLPVSRACTMVPMIVSSCAGLFEGRTLVRDA